jgi:hypothetical protein
MASFLGSWLALLACTLGAFLYQVVTGYRFMDLLPTILALEVASFVSWAFYWIVLYPSYFTPFRHLPTPPVRRAVPVLLS